MVFLIGSFDFLVSASLLLPGRFGCNRSASISGAVCQLVPGSGDRPRDPAARYAHSPSFSVRPPQTDSPNHAAPCCRYCSFSSCLTPLLLIDLPAELSDHPASILFNFHPPGLRSFISNVHAMPTSMQSATLPRVNYTRKQMFVLRLHLLTFLVETTTSSPSTFRPP